MKGYKVLLLLLTALLSFSCVNDCGDDGGRVRVSFSVAATKASPVAGVNTLDLFVFRGNGTLEAYGRETGSEIGASVVVGSPMRWHLVANAPAGAFSSVNDEGTFLAMLSRLQDNTPSTFVMADSGSRTFAAGDHVSAELSRLACKVTLESFTPQFLASAYEGCDIRLTGLFLINVVGSCPYGMTPAAGDWLNRMGMDASLPAGVAGLLKKDLDIPLTSARMDGPWSLYCMPNPVANGVHSGTISTWSPRNTRLVLEISIDGQRSWYPMTLPAMLCNHEYIINEARLLGEGSANPDIPVSRTGIIFSVSVNEWLSESKDVIFN